MKYIKIFEDYISERKNTPKPKGAPDWHDSDAPDAEGRFRDLNPKDLAKWLIKTRDGDLKRISGSLTQQIVFRRKRDPEYAEKMEKTREEVYKQLGRDDLLESITMSTSDMINYIKDLTPSDSDHPDYSLGLIKRSGKEFKLKTLKIKDILKMDKDLNDYIKSGEIRYGDGGISDLEPYDDELDQPIVIFNNEVVDGYSRTSTLYKRGVKNIQAWIA